MLNAVPCWIRRRERGVDYEHLRLCRSAGRNPEREGNKKERAEKKERNIIQLLSAQEHGRHLARIKLDSKKGSEWVIIQWLFQLERVRHAFKKQGSFIKRIHFHSLMNKPLSSAEEVMGPEVNSHSCSFMVSSHVDSVC